MEALAFPALLAQASPQQPPPLPPAACRGVNARRFGAFWPFLASTAGRRVLGVLPQCRCCCSSLPVTMPNQPQLRTLFPLGGSAGVGCSQPQNNPLNDSFFFFPSKAKQGRLLEVSREPSTPGERRPRGLGACPSAWPAMRRLVQIAGVCFDGGRSPPEPPSLAASPQLVTEKNTTAGLGE